MDFLREAFVADIPALQIIRNAVKENTLSDPALVPDSDYVDYLVQRGKGWLFEQSGKVLGFSIVDLVDKNVWALFLLPEAEGQGIGSQLHDAMLDWYFAQTSETIWLGTSPDTRAEHFYQHKGWEVVGHHGKDEIKFEMKREIWLTRKKASQN